MILGFFKKALAMAILYFYPPESWPPEDPTYVFKPFLSLDLINFIALAAISASFISSSVASGLASFIFSAIDVLNKTGSYPT